ncbi:DUF1587 domain-containing protein [bacterium]|nr:DUF1587 domain-containing protein [bacterium]
MKTSELLSRAVTLSAGVLFPLFLGSYALGGEPTVPEAASAARASSGGAPVVAEVRRVTESQYRHAINNVFGPDIVLNARFEPDPRLDGLLAVGASSASVSASGFEQYFAVAQSIAAQTLGSEKRRDAVAGCTPVNPAAADDACARAFIERTGRLLLRRPLDEEEIASRVSRLACARRSRGFGRVP